MFKASEIIRTKRRRANSPAFCVSANGSVRCESQSDLVLLEGVSPLSLICLGGKDLVYVRGACCLGIVNE